MDRGAWQATVHGVRKSWTGRKQVSMHMHGDAEGILLLVQETSEIV